MKTYILYWQNGTSQSVSARYLDEAFKNAGWIYPDDALLELKYYDEFDDDMLAFNYVICTATLRPGQNHGYFLKGHEYPIIETNIENGIILISDNDGGYITLSLNKDRRGGYMFYKQWFALYRKYGEY